MPHGREAGQAAKHPVLQTSTTLLPSPHPSSPLDRRTNCVTRPSGPLLLLSLTELP